MLKICCIGNAYIYTPYEISNLPFIIVSWNDVPMIIINIGIIVRTTRLISEVSLYASSIIIEKITAVIRMRLSLTHHFFVVNKNAPIENGIEYAAARCI